MLIRNLKIKRPSKKLLDFKKIGLFKIIKKILILNWELVLSKTMRFRINVFYISFLKLVLKNIKVDIKIEAADFEGGFEVEIILNFRVS